MDIAVPQLSLLDRGFTLGDGLFETMRLTGGTAFRLGAHMARLRAGAGRLAIPLPDELEVQVRRALREAAGAGIRVAAVRLTVSRGSGPAGLAPAPDEHPTIALTVQPLPPIPPAIHNEGIAVVIASGRRNERAMTAGVKTLAYADAVMALAEARARGAQDALFLDTDGHLSGGSASNVFLVLDDVLVTPPLSCGALAGITRAAVMECAGALGVPVAERVLSPGDIRAASDVFLTSSLRGIAPAVRVFGGDGGDHAVGSGARGACTRELTVAYTTLVRERGE
ncbi:MAG: aminotransferase class IV [Gemmatimonadota bacterium]|nr:aminotransferase class IV [Gemmatimonadota bacterium]